MNPGINGKAQVCVAALIAIIGATTAYGQGILGSNLIQNGDAEQGAAGTNVTNVVSTIPGWTRAAGGTINVVPYTLTGYAQLTNPAPPTHGFNYFIGANWPTAVNLSQDIDVSSGASAIAAGNVKFTLSAYLGSSNPSDYHGSAQVSAAFKNAAGQTFSTATIGPLTYPGNGLSLQTQIGLVPAGTARITISIGFLGLNGGYGAADSLSLVLSTLSTTPGSVLGTNLMANPRAELGAGAVAPSTALSVPGWSTANGAGAAPYGGTGWIGATDAGPADRGVNLFTGPGSSYQDLDVSPASALIDGGQATYEVSAWLGGVGANTSPTLTYVFYDWSGTQLAPTAQLGPAGHSGAALVETSHTGTLPSGTRSVRIALSFPGYTSTADDINFTLAAPGGPPVISPGSGVVSASAYGGFPSIAPGSWIEIYGTYFTSSPLRNNCVGFAGSCWAGTDFNNNVAPTSLDGVTVSIGGQAAFINFTSPGQINAQVPSTAPTGPVLVTVSNANGTSDGYPIVVNQTQAGVLAPSAFTIGGKQYVAALFADGTYALPQNAIAGVASRPAHVGETVTIYGVGFGPVSDGITAGTIVPAADQLTTPLQFVFGTTAAKLSYYGLAPSFVGLYEFNVVVPTVAPNNAEPVSFTLGGTKSSQTLYMAVQN